jgi:hypothetical protein
MMSMMAAIEKLQGGFAPAGPNIVSQSVEMVG